MLFDRLLNRGPKFRHLMIIFFIPVYSLFVSFFYEFSVAYCVELMTGIGRFSLPYAENENTRTCIDIPKGDAVIKGTQ